MVDKNYTSERERALWLKLGLSQIYNYQSFQEAFMVYFIGNIGVLTFVSKVGNINSDGENFMAFWKLNRRIRMLRTLWTLGPTLPTEVLMTYFSSFVRFRYSISKLATSIALSMLSYTILTGIPNVLRFHNLSY